MAPFHDHSGPRVRPVEARLDYWAMSDESQNVAIEVFWRLHDRLPKQGPGSDESTRRALKLVPGLSGAPRILDLGCGPGRQSLVLAQDTGGHVTALDMLPPFLAQVDERAEAAGLGDRIETVTGSMAELGAYEDERFDLLWSEGAIYNIGFESGLRDWHRVLKPGGAVAVTEATWLVPSPPERIRTFWGHHYPAMQSHEANVQAIAQAGYTFVDHFVLTESEWWDDYYTVIDERILSLRAERSDPAWVAALDEADEEAEIVRDCNGAFGYVFYVMQK